MACGSQSFQEMKACSHVLLPVHTRVGMCPCMRIHVHAAGWAYGHLCIYMCTRVHMYLCAVYLCMHACEFETHVHVCVCVLWVCGSGQMHARAYMGRSCVFICTCVGVSCEHTCGDTHVRVRMTTWAQCLQYLCARLPVCAWLC